MTESVSSSPNLDNKLDKTQFETLMFSMRPSTRGRAKGAVIPFKDHTFDYCTLPGDTDIFGCIRGKTVDGIHSDTKYPEIIFEFHVRSSTGEIEIRSPKRGYIDIESQKQAVLIIKDFIDSLPTPPTLETLADETEGISSGREESVPQRPGIIKGLRNLLKWN